MSAYSPGTRSPQSAGGYGGVGGDVGEQAALVADGVGQRLEGHQTSLNAAVAASIVHSKSRSSWASDTNQASNCEAGA